jgi:hypothetical protein
MLSFEAAATRPFATDIGYVDFLFGQSGEAEREAEELPAALEGGAFEVDGCWGWGFRFWWHDEF